jgi:ubiquinone/menaquinone biosynthesis C-methylase UbiE/DNA-binding transcriptional ArsR family regulator
MQLFSIRGLKTLSDENRLRLLNLLLFQELNVQELTEILGIGQSRVSRHLKQLTDGGFVRSRRDGLWAYYRAVDDGEPRRLLDSISYLFAEEGIYQADRRFARELFKAGKLATRRFFDTVAADWENLRLEILGELDLTEKIAAAVPEGVVVADLGCGSGALLPSLARTAATVIGIDASGRMLLEARRRIERGSVAGVQLRLGELEHLPMGDGEADWAIINLVLHHLRTPEVGLREASRVICPEGGLIVVDFDVHQEELLRSRYGDRWLGFPREEMTAWLAESGFRIDETQELPVKLGLTAVLWRTSKSTDLESTKNSRSKT